MGVVTIPFDYESRRYTRGLVPICIRDTDDTGLSVEWRWFEAVARIADSLRRLARSKLRDVWRVSELAELAVHANSRNHFGKEVWRPDLLVAAYARWTAEDLRCGHRRLRTRVEVLLGDGVDKIVDPADHARLFLNNRVLEECREQLHRKGPDELTEVLDLRLAGHSWEEVAFALDYDGSPRGLNRLNVRFARAIRKGRVSSVPCAVD